MSVVEEEDHSSQHSQSSDAARAMLWRIAKWTLCVAVVVFVVQRGRSLWQQGQLEEVTWRPGWLLGSLLVYWIGWLPSVWFWHRLLVLHGHSPPFLATTRSYFCGHLGKYIPGKATVLVIRAGLLKDSGCRSGLSAMTAAYETLLMMGVGLAIAVALSPWLLSETTRESLPTWIAWTMTFPVLPAFVVVIGCLILLPILSTLLTKIGRKMGPKPEEGTESEVTPNHETPEVIQIPVGFLALGFLAFGLSWTLHGLSLGLVLQSLTQTPFDLRAWPIWTGAVSLATSVGFLAIFAPGGVGVREGLLMESLTQQPEILVAQAVIAAVLLRFVWLVAEILAAFVLYYGVRTRMESKTDPKDLPSPAEN